MAKKQAPAASPKRPKGRARGTAPAKPEAPKEAASQPNVDLSHIVEGLRPLAFPIADLVPDAGNAMTHDDTNVAAIMGSLRQFGQTAPIVAQRDSRVIRAGHGRLEAMRRLYAAGDQRWANAAVLFVDWDNVTGVSFAIADNRTAQLAEWDKLALEKQLREVETGDEELQKMYAALAEELDLLAMADDEEPEEDGPLPEEPIPDRYSILIACRDEDHQKELLEQLAGEGLECRAMVT